VTTYAVSWHRGRQLGGGSDTASERGLSAASAYRKAVEAETTPGVRLLSVTRESDDCRITVRQLRAWARIGTRKGGQR
jgi:hypothetical protein